MTKYLNNPSFLNNVIFHNIQTNSIVVEKDKRELKKQATDFITNLIKDKQHKIIHYIIIFFNIVIRDYIDNYNNKLSYNDIMFVLKGGMSLHYYFKKYTFSNINIEEYLQEYFKPSDIDFEIIINPNLHNYEIIFEHVSIITFNALHSIRKMYLEWSPNNYENVEDFIDKLNNINVNIQIDNITFDGQQYDYIITKINGITKIGYILSNNQNNFYITYNNSLDFEFFNEIQNKLIKTKFNLIRVKKYVSGLCNNIICDYGEFNCQNSISINCPSEFIDISVPHCNSYKINKFIGNYNISEFIDNEFKIEHKETNKSYFINTYNLLYFINDLMYILYLTVNFPWDDEKYLKRINRLFICLVLYANNNSNVINILTQYFESLKNDNDYSNDNNIIEIVNTIIKYNDNIRTKINSDNNTQFLEYINDVLKILEVLKSIKFNVNRSANINV